MELGIGLGILALVCITVGIYLFTRASSPERSRRIDLDKKLKGYLPDGSKTDTPRPPRPPH